MLVTQNGEPVTSDIIDRPSEFNNTHDVAKALLALVEHLNLQLVWTNASGYYRYELKERDHAPS